MNHKTMARLSGALLQVAVMAGPVCAAPGALAAQDAQAVDAGATKWRFTMPYYDRKKQSFVCRTVATSGSKRTDRTYCRAMTVCHNALKDEHDRLMAMKGNSAAIDAVARDYYRKRGLCFRREAGWPIDHPATGRTPEQP